MTARVNRLSRIALGLDAGTALIVGVTTSLTANADAGAAAAAVRPTTAASRW